jgi:succinate-semialdehyde dehydrogenase/glutarate-semialdehyde dehydrogenase
MKQETAMYINGEWLTLAQTFPVINPANGEKIGEVADGDRRHAASAIAAAASDLPA